MATALRGWSPNLTTDELAARSTAAAAHVWSTAARLARRRIDDGEALAELLAEHTAAPWLERRVTLGPAAVSASDVLRALLAHEPDLVIARLLAGERTAVRAREAAAHWKCVADRLDRAVTLPLDRPLAATLRQRLLDPLGSVIAADDVIDAIVAVDHASDEPRLVWLSDAFYEGLLSPGEASSLIGWRHQMTRWCTPRDLDD